MPSCRKSLSRRLSVKWVTNLAPGKAFAVSDPFAVSKERAAGKRGHDQPAVGLPADAVRALPVRGQDDLLVRGGGQLVLEDHQVQVPPLQLGDAWQVAVPLVLQQFEQVKPDAEPGPVPAGSFGGQLQVLRLA